MDEVVDVNTLFGPLPAGSTDLPVEALLELMQRHRVVTACTLSTLGLLLDPSVGNAVTRATCADHTGLQPVATLNPKMYFGDRASVTRLRADGYCMVRFFPKLQGWPLDFAPFSALAQSLNETGLPIMVDIDAPGQLSALSAAIGSYSGAVIVAGADAETLAEAIHVLGRHANWYLETSRLLAPGNIRMVVDVLGPERLLFGTSAPYRPVASALHTVQHANLPSEIVNQILHKNARRLLNLL